MMKVNRGCHNTKNFNKLQICKYFFTARVFGSTVEYAATAITVAMQLYYRHMQYRILEMNNFWKSKINRKHLIAKNNNGQSCSNSILLSSLSTLFSSVWPWRLEVKVSGYQSLFLAFHFSLTISLTIRRMFDLQKAERQMVDWMWWGYVMNSISHQI